MDGAAGNGILGNGFLFSSIGGGCSSDPAMSATRNAGGVFLDYENGGENSAPAKLFATSSLPPRLSCSGNYIEHTVSKLDTLAGVAIRYGAEVADIKRLNGLVTDIQMFALKTLQIPLPGRHPPSTLSNGSRHPLDAPSGNGGHTPARHAHDDLFDSFQSLKLKSSQRKVSSAMSSLQGYYGLKSDNHTKSYGGFEMAVFSKGGSHYLEDGPFVKPSTTSGIPLGVHRKSRSVANGLFDENGANFDHTNEGNDVDSDRWGEKLIRRRQKSEMNFLAATSELLLKEDISSGAGGFSASAGKNLALRSKVSRSSLVNDSELGPTAGGGDSIIPDSIVRKSSSTSSLQDQESSSTLLSIWSLKPDLQALSTSGIGRPIFDGLPKPGKKNKTALD